LNFDLEIPGFLLEFTPYLIRGSNDATSAIYCVALYKKDDPGLSAFGSQSLFLLFSAYCLLSSAFSPWSFLAFYSP